MFGVPIARNLNLELPACRWRQADRIEVDVDLPLAATEDDDLTDAGEAFRSGS